MGAVRGVGGARDISQDDHISLGQRPGLGSCPGRKGKASALKGSPHRVPRTGHNHLSRGNKGTDGRCQKDREGGRQCSETISVTAGNDGNRG